MKTHVMKALTPLQLAAFKAGVKKVVEAKPSELIRIAIKDLTRAEKSPRYVINMSDWHAPMSNAQCAVCLAGSVIAGTLRVPTKVDIDSPDDVDGKKVNNRLRGLNYVRYGYVGTFLSYCGVDIKRRHAYFSEFPVEECDRVPTYSPDTSSGFKEALSKIAKQLTKHGL